MLLLSRRLVAASCPSLATFLASREQAALPFHHLCVATLQAPCVFTALLPRPALRWGVLAAQPLRCWRHRVSDTRFPCRFAHSVFQCRRHRCILKRYACLLSSAGTCWHPMPCNARALLPVVRTAFCSYRASPRKSPFIRPKVLLFHNLCPLIPGHILLLLRIPSATTSNSCYIPVSFPFLPPQGNPHPGLSGRCTHAYVQLRSPVARVFSLHQRTLGLLVSKVTALFSPVSTRRDACSSALDSL